MKQYLGIGFAIVWLIFNLINPAFATDFSSTNFINRDPVIDIYAGTVSSTNFEQISAGGQIAIGEASSTNFILRSGFLYFEAPTTTGGGGEVGGGSGATGAGGGTWTGSTQQGGGGSDSGFAQITFSGISNQGALINIFKDGQTIAAYQSDTQGQFQASLFNLAPGYYYFSLFSNDPAGNKSITRFYRAYVLNNSHVEIKDVDLRFPITKISELPPLAALPTVIEKPPTPAVIRYTPTTPGLIKKTIKEIRILPKKIITIIQKPITAVEKIYVQSPRIFLLFIILTVLGVIFVVLAVRSRFSGS